MEISDEVSGTALDGIHNWDTETHLSQRNWEPWLAYRIADRTAHCFSVAAIISVQYKAEFMPLNCHILSMSDDAERFSFLFDCPCPVTEKNLPGFGQHEAYDSLAIVGCYKTYASH